MLEVSAVLVFSPCIKRSKGRRQTGGRRQAASPLAEEDGKLCLLSVPGPFDRDDPRPTLIWKGSMGSGSVMIAAFAKSAGEIASRLP